MKNYELLTVFKPNLDAEEVDKAVERLGALVSELGGKVESTDKTGRKKLAYDIQKMSEGFYYFIQFDAAAEVPAELEQSVRIMDNVLRFLCVRKDEA